MVREGCDLKVFKESDCTGGSFDFVALNGAGDLQVPKLSEHRAASDFSMSILIHL